MAKNHRINPGYFLGIHNTVQALAAAGGDIRAAFHRHLENGKALDNLHAGIVSGIYACHGSSYAAGWYHDPQSRLLNPVNVGEKLMLIVSEVSEAMEAHRKDLMDDKLPNRPGAEAELADAVIRIFDLAGAMNLDLAGAVIEKMAYNAKRADHSIENRAADGGKAY
jgi:NTP pyrophosphatase (non-canonical NTP hydrolase)